MNTKKPQQKKTQMDDQMDDQISQLLALDPKEVQRVPNKGKTIAARITKVTDGDTIQVLFLHEKQVPMKLSLRIDGIDCPELNNRKQTDLELKLYEKEVATLVTNYVKQLLFTNNPQGLVRVYIKKWDKYGGRLVVDLFYGDTYTTNLSATLLEQGYANPYNGRSKKTPYTRHDLETMKMKLGLHVIDCST